MKDSRAATACSKNKESSESHLDSFPRLWGRVLRFEPAYITVLKLTYCDDLRLDAHWTSAGARAPAFRHRGRPARAGRSPKILTHVIYLSWESSDFKRRGLPAIGRKKGWRKPARLASPERSSGPN